jgi:hypothetical protein
VYLVFMQETDPPPSPVCSRCPTLFAMCPFQFLVYYSVFFFLRVGVRLPRGLCWLIPGVAVGIPYAAYLLTCYLCLPSRLGASIWWRRSPPVFSV